MATLGIVEAAKNAQDRLRNLGLSLDEEAMPREESSPGQELEITQVGNRPLRKRQAIWKQPLAEATTRREPPREVAARLSQLGGEENGLWLTANEGPGCAPLDRHGVPASTLGCGWIYR